MNRLKDMFQKQILIKCLLIFFVAAIVSASIYMVKSSINDGGISSSSSPIIFQQSEILPTNAKRVVVLELTLAELLLALQIKPIGMADTEIYQFWIDDKAFSSKDMIDIGSRQQPNLELIAQLKPDLILGIDYRHANLFYALKNIAPTILFKTNTPATKQRVQSSHPSIDNMLSMFDTIAKHTGREAQAKEVTQQLFKKIEINYSRLKQLNIQQKKMVFLQHLGGDHFWGYLHNSHVRDLFHLMGFSNALSNSGKDGVMVLNGMTALSLKPDAIMMVGIDKSSAIPKEVRDSPIWQHASVIQQNKLEVLPVNLWGFGGPISLMNLSDLMTERFILLYQPKK